MVEAAFDNPVRTIAAIAAAYYTGGAVAGWLGEAGIISSAAGGFAGGLVSSGGDFKAGLYGGVTAGAFGWAGSAGLDPFQQIAAHATIGCASASMAGGSCGAGAVSAGVAKFATQRLDNYKGLGDFHRGVAVTVIGGTASVLAGGKFENGAVTAAYGYLFNACSKSCDLLRGRGYDTRGVYNEAEDRFIDFFERPAAGRPTGSAIDRWSGRIDWYEIEFSLKRGPVNVDLSAGIGKELGTRYYQEEIGIEVYQAEIVGGRVIRETPIEIMRGQGFMWQPGETTSRTRARGCAGIGAKGCIQF